MYSSHSIGVVIPAYKVEKHIVDVLAGLPNFIDKIYVVDDGSPDKTAQLVIELNHPRARLLQHKNNRGPGAALSTGYQAALNDGIDIVVKVDGDGQMPLEQIENLITPIINGRADYTKGDRISNYKNRRDIPHFRLFGNLLLTWLTRLSSGYWYLNDSQNGFTAISAQALEHIVQEKVFHYYGYLNDILVKLKVHNYRVLDIPMPARYGKEKSSIHLGVYVIKVSIVIFSGFLWRFKRKIFQ